jgi:hypothetical protein
VIPNLTQILDWMCGYKPKAASDTLILSSAQRWILPGEVADDGELGQEVSVVWCLLQGLSQVAAGPVCCMVSTFSPVITGGNIVHLAAIANVNKTVFAVVFLEFFFSENSHFV